jgi:hypothetical protein
MLHVTNGDNAAARIRRVVPDAEVLPWRDMLHDGPVPCGLAPDELSEVRARFIAGETGLDAAEVTGSFRARDQRLRAALDEREPLLLWFEHDLYDQLQLVQILATLAPEADAMLVQADDYLGNQGVERLRELLSTAQRATSAQLQLALRAWHAFRQPTPRQLVALVDDDLSALPFLAAAVRRLLDELPAPRDGLSLTERIALRLLEGGPMSREALFERYNDSEPVRWLGDLPFFRRLERLRPLIEGGPESLTLSDVGRRVLAGRGDRMAVGVPDRWLGGCHLQAGTIWRWDAVASRLSLD